MLLCPNPYMHIYSKDDGMTNDEMYMLNCNTILIKSIYQFLMFPSI